MTPEQEKEFFRSKTFTLKGRILHPALLKPEPNKEGTKVNYNAMCVFRPEENQQVLQELGAFISQCYNTFTPGFPMQNWVNPLKKFETYVRQDGRPNAEYLRGCYWFNAATGKDVPPVVCKQGPMGMINLTEADAAEVYSGRNAVFNISFYRIRKNKTGLSTNINAVLLLEGGEKIAGGGSVDPSRIFGAFAQDMGLPQAAQFPGAVPGTTMQTQQPVQQQTAQPQQPVWPPQAAPANNNGNNGGNGPSFI